MIIKNANFDGIVFLWIIINLRDYNILDII